MNADPRSAPAESGPLAFYRAQARLMWEWRPNRLATVRRAVLSYVGACLALAIAAGVVPGLAVHGLAPLALGGFLLLLLDSGSALLLHWLLVSLPILLAQLAGLVVQFMVILILGRVIPGVTVDGPTAAIWGAVVVTLLNSLFAELVAVSDDDSYYSVLVRRLVGRDFGRAPEPVPGLLVVQIDGLSLPVLGEALRGGRAPTLARLVRDGAATLRPWRPLLPPTTPASQAGILHGHNDRIAGFRWYEKDSARLLVANRPDDAAEILRQVSDGQGLLVDDGASIGNLVTGDAPRSYLTMATIAEAAPADDERRMRGFFVTTVNYIRMLVLMAGEVVKELYQAERQRGRSVEPRMHRSLHFAVERAATNVALRTISTALVIEEMYAGAPSIYVDFTGYDTIAHHCGPERVESIDALEGIDRAIGTLLKAGRHTRREYRMVVLSDHGQSLGATFRQRHGQPLEEVIAALLPESTSIVGTTDSVESAGMGRRIAAEFGRGSGLGPLLARRLPHLLGRADTRAGAGPPDAPPDVVVCSSGNLAHVYFTAEPGRMTDEAIEARHPGLIAALARHPGIGLLVVRSAAGHAVALGAGRRLDLTTGTADDSPLLSGLGPQVADNLGHLEGFPTAGDLILLGAFDRSSGEVTGFEELVGLHGGLGGLQGQPFVLFPAGLTLADDLPPGAPALFGQLRAWRAQLQAAAGQRQPAAGVDAPDRPSPMNRGGPP